MITIKKPGAPTVDTIGQVGQHYINLANGDEYECVKIDDKRVYEKNDVKANSFFSQKVLAGADCEYIWNLVKAGGAGDGGGDWNQNDPDAPDYIKNRPFYTEFETVLTDDEQSCKDYYTLNNGNQAFYDVGFDFMGQDGDDAIVIFDGVEYASKVYGSTSSSETGYGIAIGNTSLLSGASIGDGIGQLPLVDTGEPFVIWIQFYYSNWYYLVCKDNSPHTVKVYKRNATVIKIDSKYIDFPVVDLTPKFGPFYGTCSTGSSSITKVVNLSNKAFMPKTKFEPGTLLIVNFYNNNTSETLGLKVDGIYNSSSFIYKADGSDEVIEPESLTKGLHVFVCRDVSQHWYMIM